eukprot:5116212-Pyramimonas_sp.AAC.1
MQQHNKRLANVERLHLHRVHRLPASKPNGCDGKTDGVVHAYGFSTTQATIHSSGPCAGTGIT